jgi:hypothetical protein
MRKFAPNPRADVRMRTAAVVNARSGLVVSAISVGKNRFLHSIVCKIFAQEPGWSAPWPCTHRRSFGT